MAAVQDKGFILMVRMMQQNRFLGKTKVGRKIIMHTKIISSGLTFAMKHFV